MSDIQIFNYNGNGVTFSKGDSVMVNGRAGARHQGRGEATRRIPTPASTSPATDKRT